MNIFAEFDARIKKTLQDIDLKPKDGGDLDLSRIGVEPPREDPRDEAAEREVRRNDAWSSSNGNQGVWTMKLAPLCAFVSAHLRH